MNGRRPVRTLFQGCALIAGLMFWSTANAAGPVAAVDSRIWNEWEQAARRQCPSHHLELLGDVYDELVGGFYKTLPPAVRKKVDGIANYEKRCSDEKMGFYCEMAINVDAYQKLGLLAKFADFSCKRYKCLDGAYCVNPRTGKL